MRFSSQKTRKNLIFGNFRARNIASSVFVVPVVRFAIVCLLLASLILSLIPVQSVDAKSKKVFEPKIEVMNVFPGNASSDTWNNIQTLADQNLSEDALFQNFDKYNSAYFKLKEKEIEAPLKGEPDTQSLEAPLENSQLDTLASTTGNSSENNPAPKEDVSTAETDEKEKKSEVPTETTIQTPPVDTQSQEVSLSQQSLFAIFKKAAGNFLFAQAITSEPAVETSSEESLHTHEHGDENGVVLEPATPRPTLEATAETPVTSPDTLPTQRDTVRGTTTQEENNSEALETEGLETTVSSKPERVSEYTLTLSDFGIPKLASGQFIKNLQLRLSLAGQYDSIDSESLPSLSVTYSFGSFSRDAGSILIENEISNAINGGYYLISLPSVTDPKLLSDLEITVSFNGDVEKLENLFIDALWLEIETEVFDIELLQQRYSSEEMLKHLKTSKNMDFVSNRLDFLRSESPQFNFKYNSQRNFIVRAVRSLLGRDLAAIKEISFTSNSGEIIPVLPEIHVTSKGLISVVLTEADKARMKPGLYTVEMEVKEGSLTTVDSFQFQWGLLSINTHKTEYSLNDLVHIYMGALSPNGNTVCDASLNLYVSSPSGYISNIPVSASGQCIGNNVIDVPDYSSQLNAEEIGEYTLFLERMNEVGEIISHTQDTFRIVENQKLSIARNGPTRIFPPASYPMELTVSAVLADFSGVLIERVPSSFQIFNTDAELRQYSEYQELVWDIDVEVGESITVSYDFDAPDLSPFLYELGPAKLLGDIVFHKNLITSVPQSESTDEADLVQEPATSVAKPESASNAPEVTATGTDATHSDTPDTNPPTPSSAEQELPSALDNTQGNLPRDSTVTKGGGQYESYFSIIKKAVGNFLFAQADIVTSIHEPDNSASSTKPNEEQSVPEEIAPSLTTSTSTPTTTTVISSESSAEPAVSTSTVVKEEDENVSLEDNVVFEEHRQWQIASDATGNMILYWDDVTYIPNGWSCLSCGSGTFFQRFAVGGSTYNTTGGATTHTPTASGAVTASTLATTNSNGSSGAGVAHTHTYAPTIGSASNLPAYRQLRVIQYTGAAGEPANIPTGAIGIFDVASSSLPSGWTRYAAHDGRYIRGEGTPGTTAGSNTHTHTLTGTTGAAGGTNVSNAGGVSQAAVSHTHTVSGSTVSINSEPPYINVLLAKLTATATPPNTLITMWTDEVPFGWSDVSSAGGSEFNGRFIKASTTYGGTGGTTNHQHANVTGITSSGPSATIDNVAGTAGASNLHTHAVSVTGFNTTDNRPPSLTAIYGKRSLTAQYDQRSFRWYVNANALQPTDVWPVGAVNLAEAEAITASSTPVKTGDLIRLRINVKVTRLAASVGESFKLQYGAGSSCASVSTWSTVGAATSSSIWRGYNNTSVSDHATVSSLLLATSTVAETYEENGYTAGIPNAINVDARGEWDFVLQNNGAAAGTNYCFRMVKSDGATLAAYTTYPKLLTNASPTIDSVDALFDNEKVASTSPWFEFTGLDSEGDLVDYQIQIDNDSDFSSTVIDTNSISNLDDFLNLDTPADKSPFNNNETMRYSIPSALTNGVTYWWRVRSIDASGSNLYGAWMTPRSFTIDTSVTVSTWFQTTQAQFATNAHVGTVAHASNWVAFASGSTTGTTTSTAIDFDDGKVGTSWGSFKFNGTGSPGNILARIEYFDGDVWRLIPDSALPGNSAGFGTSIVDLIDLDTVTYNQIRIRANFVSGTPTLTDWYVTWGLRVSVPTHLSLFDNEKTGTTTPTFTFFTTDPQGDDLDYQISWSTDKTFATGSTTVSSASAPGFTNLTNGGDTAPFFSGDTIAYKVQSALTNGSTYWWRVRAKDTPTSNSYSFWSIPWSLTVDTTVTTSTWFQTTKAQFETDRLVSTVASTTNSVSTIPAGVITYNFSGITNPSISHVARDFEVDVNDPTDPPTVDAIDTLTNSGTTAGAPNLRTGIAGYASDAEATNAEYTAISASDNNRWTITDPGNGDNAVFWAKFHVNESPSSITQIDVLVEGYQNSATDVAWLGIWRPGAGTPYWRDLAHSQQTADFNYTGTITTNISEYLDSNNDIHIVFFNEDDNDSLFVDYARVQITTTAAATGTITATPLDFDSGSGPAWGQMLWSDTEPGASTLLYQLQYLSGVDTWSLIPDGALPGNSTGFTTSPIDLKFLNTTTYNQIRPIGNFTCNAGNCPTLNDWTIEWSSGFTISGTAFEYDGVSSTTSGTLAVAVNGVLQIGKTGSIDANGYWTMNNVTFYTGDVVTVFVDGALDANEAVAITKYDGTPNITGMRLQKRHLTIGSDDNSTITNVNIKTYDFTNDEDLFFDVDGGNDLTMCADVGCSDAGVIILARNTYAPAIGADLVTHDLTNYGSITLNNSTFRISGSWDNNATSTMGTSNVIMTATAGTETIDSTGATASSFYNLTLGETSGSATWTLGSVLDVDNNFTVSYGTVARTNQQVFIGRNLTIGASGFWSGIGTTTFDGINPTTWLDQNATKQNVGRVLVDGTSKTTVLGSNALMHSLTIGANDTFDLGSTFTASVYGNWINYNSFLPRTGTIAFIATTTNRVISNNASGFYNLAFNGAGGAWSFTTPDISVTNNFTISTGTVTMPTGTTTITGSFTNSGGTFAHSNALVRFIGSGTKTITLNGSPFVNAFYNTRFSGTGTWSFTEANATTSNYILITQGTVTFPSDTLTVGGSFMQTGGSFIHNSGTVKFTSGAARIIDINASSFNDLSFTGSGSWSFIDASVTALGNLSVTGGTLTLPSGTLTLGGSLTNTATISHNSGTVLFNSTSGSRTINTGASSLYNMTFNSASGIWTIIAPATTTNNTTLTLGNFTLASGQTLAVTGTFTNSIGGASTTWTGSTLSLENGAYALNTKSTGGDVYATLRLKANVDVKMWNSSASTYDIDPLGSLYSQDHNVVDGDLYIFGSYERNSGTEYWSSATDFDGASLGVSARQARIFMASNASVALTGSTFQALGSSTATTTISNQGSGTYTVSVSAGTTTAQYYSFSNLASTGLTLTNATKVTNLARGAFVSTVAGGTGITVSSTTVDANPGLQIYGVNFSTTTLISAFNVTQTGGTPTSYWWFRESSGNIDGEAHDVDTGNPGSIRWDDSAFLITISGVVYGQDEITPLSSPVCDGVTNNVRVVVDGGLYASSTSCSNIDGSYSFDAVAYNGDPDVIVYLNTNGGPYASTVTRTPTANIANFDLYLNRVVTRNEDTSPLTIADMATYDFTHDTDIRFDAVIGAIDSLTVFSDTELHIASSTTFIPGGIVTIYGNASTTAFDGSLHIDDNAAFTGYSTSTITIGGSFTMDAGAVFNSGSTTVLMNASTTGKTITTVTAQQITFNQLEFTGLGGAWNLNADITAKANIHVATGTVTGTKNITLLNGSLYGNGLLSLGLGTTTIHKTNTLGGVQSWTFANLVLGSGATSGTTTPSSNATTTILGKLTISTAHFLDAGSSLWNLSGTGNVFVENGTFQEDTSTVRYSGAGPTNVISTTYYNLDLKASGSSPTYTASGLGIIITNNLTVGGPSATTINFNTNDPAVDVNGNVYIASNGTMLASNSGQFTIAGNWDNDGVFTHNSGTVRFDGSGTTNIYAGTSWFNNTIVNGTGSFTFAEHATSSGALTLTNAGSFTVASGQSLAVGGVFSNVQAGAVTTWTGSTLRLYGGSNYQINASTTNEVYNIISIGNGTQVRIWNSSASAYGIEPTASLYSQDHANVDGALNIYGAYVKISGTDYWSYLRDFDGTHITGSPRKVNVNVQNGGSILYTAGGLSVIGASTASTTIQNQGSGTYAFRVGGTASTTMSYYEIRNTNINGLTFSGTPNVVQLSNGDFIVSQSGGTAMTVGGTVITQNPAKAFSTNRFATTTVISASNVTATGTTISSWRFANHTGNIAGEAFDVDPAGDPGYIVWADSAANITISGNVYSDEIGTVSSVCGATANIHLIIDNAITSTSTTCNAGTGAYSISDIGFSDNSTVVVYIDGEAQKGATVSQDPVSNITDMNIIENRVIVRHENSSPLTIADMAVYDSSDDSDIPFTAVTGGTHTLTLPANRKLIVWTNKEFAPNGNVTVSGGGGGAAYDGTVELYTNARFTGKNGESHSVGGSLISGPGAVFTSGNSTFTFTTSGAARTIDTNDSSFYNTIFNGTGSWTVTDTNLSIGNDFTITQGAVTLPSATTTIGGGLSVTGGSFIASGGRMEFTSAVAKSIRAGGSAFNNLRINGAGTFTMLDTNATATASVRIKAGTLVSVTGTFSIGQDFVNNSAFTHSNGLLRFTSATSTVVTTNGSNLHSTTFAGNGSFTFTNTNVALLGSLRIQNGSVNLASGTMSIGGSFTNTGGSFNHASGTLLFNSTDTGETINPGSSLFHAVMLGNAGGGWTITGDATTTSHFTLSSANTFILDSGRRLEVRGLFTNLVGGAATTWTGSTLVIRSGSSYTINTKIAGGDVYGTLTIGSSTALRAWGSAATVSIADNSSSLYSQNHAGVSGALNIYGNYSRSVGLDYWSYATDFDGVALGGGSRKASVYFAANATTTLYSGTLNIIGINGFETAITNQGSGTYALRIFGGTLNAQYYGFSNMNSDGLVLSGIPVITSLTEGDFTLAVGGGSLITLSSTTLNYNTGLVISGASFATTTAITGTNVNLIGTTPSFWTFTGQTGNLSGEAFDIDGATDCGSIRWSDSTCLITQQSAYRFRNDDGGEGVPASEWFDTDWTKRQRVSINNSDAVSYADATIKVNVTYDGDMQADFGELRFTASDGVTQLNHFIESYTASTDALVWVHVPLLATSTVTEIYMYYGNGSAPDASNGYTTFKAFDDFEDGNLTEYSGDTGEFVVNSADEVYERTYSLKASDPGAGKTDFGGMYNNSATTTVSYGQTIRYFQYIDASGTGSSDESCTTFGTQNQTQNYAVCLELFGVDRMSLAKNVLHRDTSGTVLSSTTVTYSTGWYEVEVKWATNNSMFVSLYQDGSLVATTSATDSTYTTGGIGYTLWTYHGAWDIYSSRPLLTTEPSLSFGAEQVPGGASWLAAKNAIGSGIEVDETIRLRFVIDNSGLAVIDQNYQIEFAPKSTSPSCEAVSPASYAVVPPIASCGTSEVCMTTSTHITDQEPTTDLLGGVGTFSPGKVVESPDNATDNITVNADEFTELEYVFRLTSNVTDTSYCFRVTDNGSDLDSYTKVAELSLVFDPYITSLSLNGGADIVLTGGATTTVYATGTVTDLNGYTDIAAATSTIFRSGVGEGCSANNNNCYISGSSMCSFYACSGNSCNVTCSADIYYHADPTDIGTFAAETWRALLTVSDFSDAIATATAPSIDLLTLRAISVNDTIDYGALTVNSDTGTYNATTTVENIGNDSLDLSIEGTDLTDGGASSIPVFEQIFATSTFTYSSCVFCSSLATTSKNIRAILGKPSTTTPAVIDEVYWGIAIPFGVAGASHQGVNTFYAIGDLP